MELSEEEEVRNDGQDSSRSSKADSWTTGMELMSMALWADAFYKSNCPSDF